MKTLVKLCPFAQRYFDPEETPNILKEMLPYFSTSFTETAFVTVGLLNLFAPTAPAPSTKKDLLPQRYLPTYYHLWSLVNKSRTFDTNFLDLFSRLARDSLAAEHVPFNEFGIFDKEQTVLVFSAILRLLDIPVGHATPPYSPAVDLSAGLGIMLERDSRKHSAAHHIARWIVMSLSPACLDREVSVMSLLEGLIQAIENFFHPSNVGAWTKTLAQLTHFLTDFFVMRWNREENGEIEIPPDRRLNEAIKKRFVLCLRDVVFMGIYSKSTTALNYSLSTLQSLAYLEPHLILPGALQRIYPSMQGLVEVHRTTSSLRSLQYLARTLIRTKGFRCHITTLLGFALPGIDANDLDKTFYTLSFFAAVSYNIPLRDLSDGRDEIQDNMLAIQWITQEMEKLEQQGSLVDLDYASMDEEKEEMILASSTANFNEFLSSFLGRVFTLLENLPENARARSTSPEDGIVNTLPAALRPMLSSLSPALYEVALNKIVDFVANHVIYQAKDAMAGICNAVCKVNPEKALAKLVPVLISSIRTEIDENGAASTRNAAGAEILPRDRGLVWNLSLLNMTIGNVGAAVLNHKQELLDIAIYMQQKCRGTSTLHISNFIRQLLLNLTLIYTYDCSPFEPDVIERGVSAAHWGAIQDPARLSIKWHVPNRQEIEFAAELFTTQTQTALSQLRNLMDGSSSVKREGSGKDWSDEVSSNLQLLRLLLSGISVLFDPKALSSGREAEADKVDEDTPMTEGNGTVDGEPLPDLSDTDKTLDGNDESSAKPTFLYPSGYALAPDEPLYNELHTLREQTGEVLHDVHCFLKENQEDDVSCFGPLYAAFRAWFIDVGMERTAHLLDRATRILSADEQPYKVSGIRKDYPRAILVRRASVYHLQRLRHNSVPRLRSRLDEKLLMDLAESSVSLYTEVRRNAQSAGESALKVILGARLLVIPLLVDAFKKAKQENDFPRIKGAVYSLVFGSLAKTVGRNWKYTPDVIRTFIEAGSADRPSVQKLCSGALFQVMEYGRPMERMAILDEDIVSAMAPMEPVDQQIASKKAFIRRRRVAIEQKKFELAEELIELARTSHWRKATRTATIVLSLGLRFDHVASENMIKLITVGAVDTHPGLRALYAQTMVALFTTIDVRAASNHDYANHIQNKYHFQGKVEMPVKGERDGWTDEFLANFAQPQAEHYVDHDYPGWLVWGATMPAYKAGTKRDVEYDELEWTKRKAIGQWLTRDWFVQFFAYMKQEPRDSAADKFRMANAMMLLYVFELMVRDELAVATLDEIQQEILTVFGDGSDKHQHRATAEILGGLIGSVLDSSIELREMVWAFCFPLIKKIFEDGLTPENSGYWTTFLHMVVQGQDPRRAWPLVQWLANFRLDMTSNAAFKESSQINLLQQCVIDTGWHFRLEKGIVQDFVGNIDHPYKGVREAMSQTLAVIFRTRHHESYPNVDQLIEKQELASSTGLRPYQPTTEFTAMMEDILAKIAKWRQERPPGQQSPSSYTSGGKTVLLLLDNMLSSYDCVQLLPFISTRFIDELLAMMDVKEDPELAGLAYHVFRHLPNIPHRVGEDIDMIDTLIRIGRSAASWHQRLRVMVNMQIIFFRRLFLISEEHRQKLLDCVAGMLEDSKPEVRMGASATLSGMIQCSPAQSRGHMVAQLCRRFTKMLEENPLPKKAKKLASSASSSTLSSTQATGTNTPTPEHQRLVVVRHAAVLGLGSLIQAFPYMSPPPAWMPEVLITLSSKAANDPGNVGSSVKTIISDFKKTRQDTWHIDVKVSTLSPGNRLVLDQC